MLCASLVLPTTAACSQEVDDLFYKYGKITSIDIKPGTGAGVPAYCFVEFSSSDDAYDAVKALDGRDAFGGGRRLRVGGVVVGVGLGGRGRGSGSGRKQG